MITAEQLITRMPIDTLNFSPEFKELCKKLGFDNLDGLLEKSFTQLRTIKEFDERMQQEYLEFMNRVGLGKLIRP